MKKIIFKQSRNWWQEKDLDWILENALFVFTDDGHKGNRPKIVTKESIKPFDTNCFEIDNDRYGIIVVSESRFMGQMDSSMTMKETRIEKIPEFVADFLIKWGAGEFVNPKFTFFKSLANDLRRKQDKYFSVVVNTD